ncbi:MAG: DUF4097 family beta strand repeat-containing protein [Eubacterium sp.]
MKNKNNVNPLFHALLPVIITIAYILIGFFFDSGWAIGWILFLLIPIIETLINAIKTKNPSHFAYPVFVTAVFLFTGMMWGLWHPMWVLFVTIPAYYAICDAVKKPKPQQQAEYQQEPAQPNNNSVYYQPPVEVPLQQPKNNLTAVIVTVIVSITAIIIVAIICTFAWLSGGSINVHGIFDDDAQSIESYVEGPYNVSTDGIENIDIEWVSGNVDVQYYDGDTIYIEESSKSDKNPMTYKVEGKTLYIDEFINNSSTMFSNKLKKDLIVKLPNGFKTDYFNIDIVSAELTASLDTLGFELNSVSGDSHISFVSQPQEIETDTVSGDIRLVFPEDISGYSISDESISGSINTNDFGNTIYYGDGYTRIEHDAVSGDLTIEKAE